MFYETRSCFVSDRPFSDMDNYVRVMCRDEGPRLENQPLLIYV